MSTTKLSTTHTLLATAILLMLGVMACPNTPWDAGDPARELERMHARFFHERTNVPSALESLNLLVRQTGGDPAPGVSFRICDPARHAADKTARSAERDRVYYEGVTGADGRCVATFRMPASLSELRIEWSAPNAANEAGQLAPESWQYVARTLVKRSELSMLELSLPRL